LLYTSGKPVRKGSKKSGQRRRVGGSANGVHREEGGGGGGDQSGGKEPGGVRGENLKIKSAGVGSQEKGVKRKSTKDEKRKKASKNALATRGGGR